MEFDKPNFKDFDKNYLRNPIPNLPLTRIKIRIFICFRHEYYFWVYQYYCNFYLIFFFLLFSFLSVINLFVDLKWKKNYEFSVIIFEFHAYFTSMILEIKICLLLNFKFYYNYYLRCNINYSSYLHYNYYTFLKNFHHN